MTRPRLGVIVNPAAGRDIRRLTGGASVIDDDAKRRVTECVIAGLDVVADPPDVLALPDTAGIAASATENPPEEVRASLLDIELDDSAGDTRRAAARFRESCDAIVVLGGDGTTRDVALESGDVPLLAVSTGTNNVVPTAVDGTVAGAAAALVATGAVDAKTVTDRHRLVEGRIEGGESVTGIASVELVDRPFVGTRAMIDPSELLGGVVSRASPGAIGLPGVVGTLGSISPTSSVAGFVELRDPPGVSRTASAVLAPGVVATVGIETSRRLHGDDAATVEVREGVLGADGERELELVDETVTLRSVSNGPRIVDFERVFAAVTRDELFVEHE